jgi:hypothetical protein
MIWDIYTLSLQSHSKTTLTVYKYNQNLIQYNQSTVAFAHHTMFELVLVVIVMD